MYYLFHYINVIAIAFSVYCLTIAFSRGVRKLPMIFLFISNMVLISNSVFIWLIETELIYAYPHYIRVPAPFHYLLGPSIYLFVRTFFQKDKSLKKWDWLHFLPFVIHFVELIPFYLQDSAIKIEMAHQIARKHSATMLDFKEGVLPSKVHTFLKFSSWLCYLWLTQKTYLTFKNRIKSSLITDYNRKFSFINFYLITKYIGLIGILFAIFLSEYTSQFIILFIGANVVSIFNVFVLAFKFPEMIYGEVLNTSLDNNRERLMDIVKTQTTNLKYLESSICEANILLDINYRVLYYDKLGEVYFRKIYNRELKLGEDYSIYLDDNSLKSFLACFKKAINGITVKLEDKFLLSDGKTFIWMELSYTPHYAEKGHFIGVSIGANIIDEKKRMEFIQLKYKQSLDQLAWNSSHLLRAPVSNISGILNVLKDKSIIIDENERQFFIDNLSSEVNKLDAVIKNMVAKARQEVDE